MKAKDCRLGIKYRNLGVQAGSKQKVLMAIAGRLVVIIYRLMSKGATYQEPASQPASSKSRHRSIQRHLRGLGKLGLMVRFTPTPAFF